MALVSTVAGCGSSDDADNFGALPDIAYDSQTAVRVYDIFVASAGGDVQQITDDRLSYGPAWSPDGQQIAFVRGKPGSAEECCGYGSERIWVMDADGSNAEPVSTSDPTTAPRWTPDGTGLMFIAVTPPAPGEPEWKETNVLIRVDLASGDEEVIFEDMPWRIYDLYLSPDGESFVRGAREAILTTNLATGEVTTEADGVFKGGSDSVSWSPDGEWFAATGVAEGTAAARFWAWNIEDDRLVPIEIGRGAFGGYTWTGPAELLYCYTELVEEGAEGPTYERQLRRVKLGDDPVEVLVTDFRDSYVGNNGKEFNYCLGDRMDARTTQ